MEDITTPESIAAARVLIFPGVGSFGSAMANLASRGLIDALREYVRAGRPFFGICLGMQTLFEGSEESPGVAVRILHFKHPVLLKASHHQANPK